MTQMLEGMHFGKGQRLCDLVLINQGITETEILDILKEGIREGTVTSYDQQGQTFYLEQEPVTPPPVLHFSV
jgi:hypothetical protein